MKRTSARGEERSLLRTGLVCRSGYMFPMINQPTGSKPNSATNAAQSHRHHSVSEEHVKDIIIHAEVSSEFDADKDAAQETPLRMCTDEQLLAELARRKIDVHSHVTDEMVKKTYIFEKELGHGASGKVYLVTHKVTGEKFACKVVHKDGGMNDAQSMATEIEIMKRLRHRHVVSMYELYESAKCLWIILELVTGGDLSTLITKKSHYTEKLAAHYFRQILLGVHYLHSRGVVHRDLKLPNILILGNGEEGDVKIADFGLSALVLVGEHGYDVDQSNKRKQFSDLKECWGTPTHYAPELIRGAYGPQADIWSLGVILYEMLTGRLPFECGPDDSEEKLYHDISHGSYNKERLHRISHEAADLISKLLTVNPSKRFSATEALTHPWVTGSAHGDHHDQHLEDGHAGHKEKAETKAITRERSSVMEYFFGK